MKHQITIRKRGTHSQTGLLTELDCVCGWSLTVIGESLSAEALTLVANHASEDEAQARPLAARIYDMPAAVSEQIDRATRVATLPPPTASAREFSLGNTIYELAVELHHVTARAEQAERQVAGLVAELQEIATGVTELVEPLFSCGLLYVRFGQESVYLHRSGREWTATSPVVALLGAYRELLAEGIMADRNECARAVLQNQNEADTLRGQAFIEKRRADRLEADLARICAQVRVLVEPLLEHGALVGGSSVAPWVYVHHTEGTWAGQTQLEVLLEAFIDLIAEAAREQTRELHLENDGLRTQNQKLLAYLSCALFSCLSELSFH
jgi:hypothetical protein